MHKKTDISIRKMTKQTKTKRVATKREREGDITYPPQNVQNRKINFKV